MTLASRVRDGNFIIPLACSTVNQLVAVSKRLSKLFSERNMGLLLLFLQNFYKNEFNRKEMYLRYIYKLHDLHLAAENYTEAGFTMKLYADQLGWGSTVLPPDHAHPQQPEWQRKELLYHKIIHYLDRGKCWEKGIPLCKELAILYETRLYDYAKLSHVLKLQAKFLDNILTQLRPEPEYFRVGFYGLSFPLFVRVSLMYYPKRRFSEASIHGAIID